MRSLLRLLGLLLLLVPGMIPASGSRAAELVMFESASCEWCAAWHREVGPIYPKTAEARRAPLRRVDIDAPRPPDLAFIRGIRYTPTFVLIDRGRELGRITGYPGEDFFWALLDELLARLDRMARNER